MSNTFHKKLRT